MITEFQFDPRSFFIGWILAPANATLMAKLDLRKWVPDDWRKQIAGVIAGDGQLLAEDQ